MKQILIALSIAVALISLYFLPFVLFGVDK